MTIGAASVAGRHPARPRRGPVRLGAPRPLTAHRIAVARCAPQRHGPSPVTVSVASRRDSRAVHGCQRPRPRRTRPRRAEVRWRRLFRSDRHRSARPTGRRRARRRRSSTCAGRSAQPGRAGRLDQRGASHVHPALADRRRALDDGQSLARWSADVDRRDGVAGLAARSVIADPERHRSWCTRGRRPHRRACALTLSMLGSPTSRSRRTRAGTRRRAHRVGAQHVPGADRRRTWPCRPGRCGSPAELRRRTGRRAVAADAACGRRVDAAADVAAEVGEAAARRHAPARSRADRAGRGAAPARRVSRRAGGTCRRSSRRACRGTSGRSVRRRRTPART